MEFKFLYWLQTLHTPVLDRLMTGISFLGNSGACFILLGLVLLCFRKTRKTGLAVLISLIAGFLIGNMGLKNMIMRQRPCWLDPTIPLLLSSPHDYSFPSGHTLAAFEAAVSVFLYHRRWGYALLVFAVVIGFSRMYLFVHFPSDVLVGALLGTGIAFCVHKIFEKRKNCAILKANN